MTTDGEQLEARAEAGGRYFLAGRPVHNGDVVEVALKGGGWLALRLEGMPRELLGFGLPALDGGHEMVVKVPSCARFRWPEPGERGARPSQGARIVWPGPTGSEIAEIARG